MPADWGTVVAGLKADLRNLAGDDAVKRRLVESIRHHRSIRVHQSEADFSFALADGVYAYAPGDDGGGAGSPGDYLPADFLEPIGELFAQEAGTTTKRIVTRVTPHRFEELRATDESEATVPLHWAIFARELRLWQTPDDSATVLYGRYQLDLGVPVVVRESGVFKYYLPDESAEITDTWAPGWFSKDNQAMVEAYAKHLLWKEMKDPESAATWYDTWIDYRADVADQVEGLTGPATLAPWPAGPATS